MQGVTRSQGFILLGKGLNAAVCTHFACFGTQYAVEIELSLEPARLLRKIAAMIRINRTLAIREDEIEEQFVRASGPGGQNVNKVSTAVQLRFDVAHSPSLPEDVRARLILLAGRRIGQDGMLTIEAQRFRSQGRNRDDARARLAELVRQASEKPKIRRATQPTRTSQQRRLEDKQRHGAIKKQRRNVAE